MSASDPAPRVRLADVFGVSRSVPKTYVSRVGVDGKFVNSLARDKHLVVFGGSKQGKTCLRKVCLEDSDYVVVQCNRSTAVEQIYETVLKEAGASVSVSKTETAEGKRKFAVTIGGKGSIPFVSEVSGDGSYENEKTSQSSTESKSLEIDPRDPNDVIRILLQLKFKRYIILEDFHYLDESVQRQLAIDLKAFHEKSTLCFIIVAVWRESNRLVLYNGDLAGRLIPVDADEWSAKELEDIINQGEKLLNVAFSDEVKEKLVSKCQGSVGILQEACQQLCEKENVFGTVGKTVTFANPSAVDAIFADIAKEHAGRYENFLTDFVKGFQKTELQMYRWIAQVVVTAEPEELKRGLRASEVHSRISAEHPQQNRLLYNNTIQALANVGKLQHQNKVQPFILDYNPNDPVLFVVDGGFLVYLASHSREELVALLAPSESP